MEMLLPSLLLRSVSVACFGLCLFVLSACVVPETLKLGGPELRDQKHYSADKLIVEWREGLNKNFPPDNDADYAYPQHQYINPRVIQRQHIPAYNSPYSYAYPVDNDATYQAPYIPYKPGAPNASPYDLFPNQTLNGGTPLPVDNDAEYNYPLYFDN